MQGPGALSQDRGWYCSALEDVRIDVLLYNLDCAGYR